MLKNKSKFVKSVYDNKKLLAIFVKKSFFKYIDQTTFLTGNKELFQMGFIRKNNELIQAHFHPDRKRIINKTSEFLILKKGKAKIKFFKNKNKLIESFNMNVDDMLLIYDGAHEITCSKNCLFLEIKQGPYNIKKDKKLL